MQITINEPVVFRLFDELLARSTATPKAFPYNKKDAVIPQTLIPRELREDTIKLACFYFFVCIYMRGGIESGQAFRALLEMYEKHPDYFDPWQAQWLTVDEVQTELKKYIGWDSLSAAKSWVENSNLLMRYWKGNPLELLKGLRSYDEALRRIRNKRTKRDQKAAGHNGFGFRGFQPKMVSMLIYFYDWEGLLEKRFLYPAPADFHNFRLALNQGGIRILSNEAVLSVRSGEALSKPWRDVLMKYLKERGADPIQLADAIWLFSLVMCGNSPIVRTPPERLNGSGMFELDHLPHHSDEKVFLAPRFRRQLQQTCLRCPLLSSCSLSIPALPYYRKGLLVLLPRPRIEDHLDTISPDAPYRQHMKEIAVHEQLFEPDEQ